jgi:glycosyltransferase involved in cell wall biosynthesis
MTVSFWITSTTRKFTKDNWDKIPLGGAEGSAVNLGIEFIKRGIDVYYYLQNAESYDEGKLHVRKHYQVQTNLHDIFICVRPHPILSPRANKGSFMERPSKIILWSGDAFDQSSNKELFHDKLVCDNVDHFIFKSEWQRRTMLESFTYIKPEKSKVHYNGVREEHFYDIEDIVPERNLFIHASTFYRGVYNFLDIWPKIRERIPEAKLRIYSKTSLYMAENPRDNQFQPVAEKLAQIPGIEICEPIPEKELIKELKRSWLMLYPNTGFVESSCGVALQSVAAGTPVVATNRAGLPETIQDNGILVEEKEGWQDNFTGGVIKLWENENERNSMGELGSKRVLSQYNWSAVAENWLNFLKS